MPTKSVISEISDATIEVKRRTCTVRDEATESQLTNKGCATSKDFSGRTRNEYDNEFNQLISYK